MPNYIEYNGRKYYPRYYCCQISGPERTTLYLHREVWKDANGEIPEGHVIHHKDGDKSNNALENLECLPTAEHLKIHRCGQTGIQTKRFKCVCVICNKEFASNRRTSTTCSKKCKYRLYRQRHLEECRARARKYHQDNAEKERESRAKRHKTNRERDNTKSLEYYYKNRKQCLAAHAKYRERKKEEKR